MLLLKSYLYQCKKWAACNNSDIFQYNVNKFNRPMTYPAFVGIILWFCVRQFLIQLQYSVWCYYISLYCTILLSLCPAPVDYNGCFC